MKPTHGLVPYTGVMPIEATLDHTGPITANVQDNALMLEVLAGPDGLDPRQYASRRENYTAALNKGVRGLKIGVVTEGFQLPNLQPLLAEKVRNAVARLESLGAHVGEVSVPGHQLAAALWSPIGCEGLTMQMMHGNGMDLTGQDSTTSAYWTNMRPGAIARIRFLLAQNLHAHRSVWSDTL
jgi:amidase